MLLKDGELTDEGVDYVVAKMKKSGFTLSTCAASGHGQEAVKFVSDGRVAHMSESASGGPLIGEYASITYYVTEEEFVRKYLRPPLSKRVFFDLLQNFIPEEFHEEGCECMSCEWAREKATHSKP